MVDLPPGSLPGPMVWRSPYRRNGCAATRRFAQDLETGRRMATPAELVTPALAVFRLSVDYFP